MKNNPTKMKKKTKTDSTFEMDLVFDGDNVNLDWYHPKLKPIICALCGKKNCDGKNKDGVITCVFTNPWCG